MSEEGKTLMRLHVRPFFLLSVSWTLFSSVEGRTVISVEFMTSARRVTEIPNICSVGRSITHADFTAADGFVQLRHRRHEPPRRTPRMKPRAPTVLTKDTQTRSTSAHEEAGSLLLVVVVRRRCSSSSEDVRTLAAGSVQRSKDCKAGG